MVAHILCNFRLSESTAPLLTSAGTLYARGAHTHMQTNTHARKTQLSH